VKLRHCSSCLEKVSLRNLTLGCFLGRVGSLDWETQEERNLRRFFLPKSPILAGRTKDIVKTTYMQENTTI